MKRQATTKPIGIQRKRTDGWRMPANTIYVGRPSRWGNPFQAGAMFTSMNRMELEYDFSSTPSPISSQNKWGCETVFGMCSHELGAEIAVLLFRRWLEHWGAKWPADFEKYIEPLRGKNLACWCPPDAYCHRNVLLEFANP
jgi:hypothetical protein